jgi:hypothetical protein
MHEQSWKVTLPGLLYERAGQWWWEAKLPGEDQARTLPLNVPAGCGAQVAEKAALDLWEQAVVRNGARQIILDCTQKVERFKAQFLDKLRRLTEIVESASAKAQAEASARAQMEARLNAMILATGFGSRDTGRETTAPISYVPDSPVIEGGPASSEYGFCECCGAMNTPTEDLEQIHSGQLLCPDCLHNLRVDALRAELDTLTEGLA